MWVSCKQDTGRIVKDYYDTLKIYNDELLKKQTVSKN